MSALLAAHLPVIAGEHQRVGAFGKLQPSWHAAVSLFNRLSLEPGGDVAARFGQQFDDVDSREPTADVGQFGTDPLVLIVQPMTLQTLRFLDDEEQFAAAFDVA